MPRLTAVFGFTAVGVYLYFGAAPAVTFLLPYRLLTGEYLPTPWAILVFCWVGFLAASAVWLSARSRYFSRSPSWTDALGVLVIGIGCGATFFWVMWRMISAPHR